VVKEERILKDCFLFSLLFKGSGDRSSFAMPHSLQSPETTPEATRISLVAYAKLQDLALLPPFL
jgi:hypothetical protein